MVPFKVSIKNESTVISDAHVAIAAPSATTTLQPWDFLSEGPCRIGIQSMLERHEASTSDHRARVVTGSERSFQPKRSSGSGQSATAADDPARQETLQQALCARSLPAKSQPTRRMECQYLESSMV